MTTPLIIQQGTRKAVIDGNRVALLKLHNKRKPTGVWPETAVPSDEIGFHAAVTWVVKGFIDLPEVPTTNQRSSL
jgi:hypothetical protein